MTEREILIEKYVAAVLRKIPENQRADIGQELRGMIDDMLEERFPGEETTREQAESILNELGDPAEMARKYRGQDKHVIGEQYYDMYWKVLKLVLMIQAAVWAGCWTIRIILHLMKATMQMNVEDFILIPFTGDGLWDLIPQLLASVGAVTLVFMLIEYHHVKVGRPAEAWTVAKLHTEPSGGKPIKRADSIVSLVFTTIFLTVLCAAPEFLGAWVKEADESFRGISIFHMKTFYQILPWFILAFGMKMVRDVVILCVPRYTPGVCAVIYITEILSFLVTVFVMTTRQVFNPTFVQEIETAFRRSLGGSNDLMNYYTPERLGYIIILIALIGTIVTFVKTTVALVSYRKHA